MRVGWKINTATNSGPMSPRLACGVAFAAQYRPADLGMKRDLVMFSAVVANDIKPLRSLVAGCGFFGPAFCTTLRRHHIALVKHLLLLFSEQKDLLTLHTRNFNIRHRCFLL